MACRYLVPAMRPGLSRDALEGITGIRPHGRAGHDVINNMLVALAGGTALRSCRLVGNRYRAVAA